MRVSTEKLKTANIRIEHYKKYEVYVEDRLRKLNKRNQELQQENSDLRYKLHQTEEILSRITNTLMSRITIKDSSYIEYKKF